MDKIPEIIEAIRKGEAVILVDDESRENEGDLIVAADYITPQMINFMACEARGLICAALTKEKVEQLGIPLMVRDEVNYSPNKTAFTVSVEASEGVTTGISAEDRAQTIRVISRPSSRNQDIVVPGHIFPIQAQDGGVLRRAGHTEASVDLSILAGLTPAAVICEVMNEDGTMARVPELKKFAKKHNIKIGTIEDLIEYRLKTESFVQETEKIDFPCRFGDGFEVRSFKNQLDGREHLTLSKGDLSGTEPVLVRVHRESVLGDVFGSLLTPSDQSLEKAMQMIDKEGRGVIIYLRAGESGLERQMLRHAYYENSEAQADTVKKFFEMDERDYGVGAQILRALGVEKIRLMTNKPLKRVGLKGFGLEISENVQMKTDTEDVSFCENKKVSIHEIQS